MTKLKEYSKHYKSEQIKPVKMNLEMGNQGSNHLLKWEMRMKKETTWRK